MTRRRLVVKPWRRRKSADASHEFEKRLFEDPHDLLAADAECVIREEGS